MYFGIHMLEIADGLKDALIHAGFTIESILNLGPGEIASTIGIDIYVAKIIFRAAEKAVNMNSLSTQKNNLIKPIKVNRQYYRQITYYSGAKTNSGLPSNLY
jgi:hypothetical protein